MNYLNYTEATWEEFEEKIKEVNSLILIPIGCFEEHGPHLPINTDGIIAREICEQVARLNNVILGPDVSFGLSRTTQGFPGTIEIRVKTLRTLIFDIVYSFASQGVKNIVIFNWHGGTTHATIVREAIIDVLEKIRVEKHLPKFLNIEKVELLPHVYVLGGVRLLDGELEVEINKVLESKPFHAAELETSLILYLRPEMVKLDKIKDLKEFPDFPKDRIFARGNPWMKKGLIGDATRSTAEKGRKIFEIFLGALTERIKKYTQ